jgi:peptidoglycan/LPS O-acetylase OafA/YrhL
VLAACLDLAGGPGDRPYARATLDAIPWVMVFAGNWAPALGISPFLGLLGPAWSLAVEEQFYLLWPALFVLLMRRGLSRGRLALSLAVIAAAEMTYRVVMAHLGYGPGHIFYGTDTRSDGLIVGCAVAFWLASGQPARLHDRACKRLKGLAWLGAAVLGILFLIAAPVHASVEVGVAVLASGALVIGHVAGQTPAALERLLCSWWAVWIGRRSYGLYLWHFVVIAMARGLVAPYTGIYPIGGERRIIFAVVTGVAVAVSFGTAELSYRFVELPALRRKRRFQSEATQTTGGRPAGGQEGAPIGRGPVAIPSQVSDTGHRAWLRDSHRPHIERSP